MRLATYRHQGRVWVGVVEGDTVRPAGQATTMLDVITGAGRFQAESLPLSQVRLLAPIPRPPRNVLCVGKNYLDHAGEFDRSGFNRTGAGSLPEAPVVFTKPPESVIGPDAQILLPRDITSCLDYEAELAVVIGMKGRGITPARALDHVFGYTIVNDVTARDLQARHTQWFLGKALDTSCPMGPWIVTADEIDPTTLEIRCWVNDEPRQHARTEELLFDIPTLVSTISAGTTLHPGDIIATGTPAGVGAGFDPPRFLADGDTVRVEISGIGTLTNTVRVL
ncbi:fumarylacetoacetate hydrolase family protein [Nonomuraea sp. B5E05]|uniref:fumarylacetoacetate hydrolase family protein n=1 Tax=Nonomuraea sp. B5E05 TaxID=3153569 RepID=UPI0032602D68